MKKKKTIVTKTSRELAKAIGLTNADALKWEKLGRKAKRYGTLNDFGASVGMSSEQVAISKMKTKIKKTIIIEAKKRCFSATDLALVSGLPRAVVSGILNGRQMTISLERLIKLAAALDLTVGLSIKKRA